MSPANESNSPRTRVDVAPDVELATTFVADCTPSAPTDVARTLVQSEGDEERSAVRSMAHSRFNVPGFEILAELGRGGVGIVFKARQVALNRIVALKELLGDGRGDDRATIRFLAEAEAVAAVKHPHVVEVYEFGEADGRQFLALEYLPGGTLDERIGGPGKKQLPPTAAAKVVEKIARGVAAAHRLGIVHRDLKPGNVLFDLDDEPKVTDFGIAKRSTGVELTQTQQVMGTPAYMAPEQARGDTKFVGPPADVYALGVILYEAVTGSRPFHAPDAITLLRKVAEDVPVSPRKSVPVCPRDLALICLKCLAKDARDRYETAEGLADDLGRFLAGLPVSVRAPGTTERIAKWARRKPTLAAAYALASAVLVLGAFGITLAVLWLDAEDARTTAEFLKQREEIARNDAVKARDAEAKLRYAGDVRLALDEYDAHNLTSARALLKGCPEPLRNWEWRYLHRLCHADWVTLDGHTDVVSCVAFSRRGPFVATAGADKTARVWDRETGKLFATLTGHTKDVTAVGFSPDGTKVVTASKDGTARLWATTTGKELAVLKGHSTSNLLRTATFSPDGSRVLLTDDTAVGIWSAVDGKELHVLTGHTGRVTAAAFNPAGDRIVTGSVDETARVWDANSGAELQVLKGHTLSVEAVAFGPGGARVATASSDKTARLWDPETGKEIAVLRGHTRSVTTVRFNGDGTRVLTAGPDGSVWVWYGDTGKAVVTLPGPAGPVAAAMFVRDGDLVATGSAADWLPPIVRSFVFGRTGGLVVTTTGDTAHLWDVDTGTEVRTLRGHTEQVLAAAVSPDGTRIATAGKEGGVRVWDAAAGAAVVVLRGHTEPARSVAFHRDGKRLVTGSRDSKIRLWDPIAGTPAGVLPLPDRPGHLGQVSGVVFHPDGDRILSASWDNTAAIWDLKTRERVTEFRGHTGNVITATFCPTGDRVLTASDDYTARVWDAATAREVFVLRGHKDWVTAALFHPTLPIIVTAGRDNTIRYWDATTGMERLVVTTGHVGGIRVAAFNPAGTRLVTAGADKTVRIWVAETDTDLAVLRGHTGPVAAVAFSPDGTRLVSGSDDFTARVWDPVTGKELVVLRGHPAGVAGVAFSHDGTRIATACDDNLIRLFDSAPVNRQFLQTSPTVR